MGVNPLALLDGNMAFEGLGVPSLWDYNETVEVFNQLLVDKTLEFQTFQMNAREELKKYVDQNNKLVHALKLTAKERDEERERVRILQQQVDQLQFLMKKFETKCNNNNNNNSSVTESDASQSYVSSSPVIESFFDVDTGGFHQQSPISKYDQARLDQLIANRPLPEKGKLLDAVSEAGPLLHTLMVAGSLPRWKNPPPLEPVHIPPIAGSGRNMRIVNRTAAIFSPNSLGSSPFSGLNGETTSTKRSMILPCIGSFPCLSAKRQKSQ